MAINNINKKLKLSQKDISRYYHRSYKTADGLWFVKAEEKYGFEKALEIDSEVWKVMPKIQARYLKEKLKKDHGLEALLECFSVKLDLDGFEFKVEKKLKNPEDDKASIQSIRFLISRCPWHDILVKSGRSNISNKIGSVICNTEYGVWAKEFGNNIRLIIGGNKICRGDSSCIIKFFTGP